MASYITARPTSNKRPITRDKAHCAVHATMLQSPILVAEKTKKALLHKTNAKAFGIEAVVMGASESTLRRGRYLRIP